MNGIPVIIYSGAREFLGSRNLPKDGRGSGLRVIQKEVPLGPGVSPTQTGAVTGSRAKPKEAVVHVTPPSSNELTLHGFPPK